MTARQLMGVMVMSAVVSAGVGFGLGQATSPDVASAARAAARSHLTEIQETVGEIKHLAKHNGTVLRRLENRIGDTQIGSWGLTGALEVTRFNVDKAVDLAYFTCVATSEGSNEQACQDVHNKEAPTP